MEEAKVITEETIAKLTERGFKRWTKGSIDRLYVSAEQLGLVCEHYKTGNVSNAEFRGESISNSQAKRMKVAKTFIDVKTGRVFSDVFALGEAAKSVLTEVKGGE